MIMKKNMRPLLNVCPCSIDITLTLVCRYCTISDTYRPTHLISHVFRQIALYIIEKHESPDTSSNPTISPCITIRLV